MILAKKLSATKLQNGKKNVLLPYDKEMRPYFSTYSTFKTHSEIHFVRI